MKYKYHLLLVVLSDAKIGLTHGKDLAVIELGEETATKSDKEAFPFMFKQILFGEQLRHQNDSHNLTN